MGNTVLPENAMKKAPVYINAVYERYLGRSANKEELNLWMKRPDDMGAITNAIRDSAAAKEFQGALMSVGDEPERAKAAWNKVTAMTMKNTLGRMPTQAELDKQWDAVKGYRGEKLWHYGMQATANTEKYLKSTYKAEYEKAAGDTSDAAAIRTWAWKGPSNIVYGVDSQDNDALQRGQLFTMAEGRKAGNRSYDTGMRTSDGQVIYAKGERKSAGIVGEALPAWGSEFVARSVTGGLAGKEFWNSKAFATLATATLGHLGDDVAGITAGDEARAKAAKVSMKIDKTLMGDRFGKNVNKMTHQVAPAVVSTVVGIVATPVAGAAVGAALNVGTAATSAGGDVGKAAIMAAASLATAGAGQYLQLGTAAQAGVGAASSAAATKLTGGSWSEAARAGAIAAASPYLKEMGQTYGWTPAQYGLAKGGVVTGVTAATGGSVKESLAAGVTSGATAAGGQILQNYVADNRNDRALMEAAKESVKGTDKDWRDVYNTARQPPATSPLTRPMAKPAVKAPKSNPSRPLGAQQRDINRGYSHPSRQRTWVLENGAYSLQSLK
jgi:hypothetical protein